MPLPAAVVTATEVAGIATSTYSLIKGLFCEKQTAMGFRTYYKEGYWYFELLNTGGVWSVVSKYSIEQMIEAFKMPQRHEFDNGVLHEGIKWRMYRLGNTILFDQLIKGGEWPTVATISEYDFLTTLSTIKDQIVSQGLNVNIGTDNTSTNDIIYEGSATSTLDVINSVLSPETNLETKTTQPFNIDPITLILLAGVLVLVLII